MKRLNVLSLAALVLFALPATALAQAASNDTNSKPVCAPTALYNDCTALAPVPMVYGIPQPPRRVGPAQYSGGTNWVLPN